MRVARVELSVVCARGGMTKRRVYSGVVVRVCWRNVLGGSVWGAVCSTQRGGQATDTDTDSDTDTDTDTGRRAGRRAGQASTRRRMWGWCRFGVGTDRGRRRRFAAFNQHQRGCLI